MREQTAFRFFCRHLHGPPLVRCSRCLRNTDDVIKRPDPSTYDAELAFASR